MYGEGGGRDVDKMSAGCGTAAEFKPCFDGHELPVRFGDGEGGFGGEEREVFFGGGGMMLLG